MIAPAVGVAAAAAHVLVMAAVVRADCVVTALTQMALTAVTHNIVEEDGSCTPSTLNMNAIAETGTRNCRVDVQKIISKRQQFKFKRGATSCYIKLDLRRHAASQYVQLHYVYRLNRVKRFLCSSEFARHITQIIWQTQ